MIGDKPFTEWSSGAITTVDKISAYLPNICVYVWISRRSYFTTAKQPPHS